jgi:hypothetical protein
MRKRYYILFTVALFANHLIGQNSFQFEYIENDSISNKAGFAKNEQIDFFPLAENIHGGYTKPAKFLKKYCHKFDEPILYNFYLDKEIIRFFWFRSFDRPVMIKIEYDTLSVNLTSKILSKVNYEEIDDKRPFKKNITNQLDINEFLVLNTLITDNKIKSEIPNESISGADGSVWILEFHDKSGYYYINRYTPMKGDPIRLVCEYLIQLSEIKEEIY